MEKLWLQQLLDEIRQDEVTKDRPEDFVADSATISACEKGAVVSACTAAARGDGVGVRGGGRRCLQRRR